MSTTEEIYNNIVSEKESGNYPELDTLDSTSKVSVWRLFVWIFAFFSKAIEELFASHKSYIEDVFAKNQHGSLAWWISECKKFQDGDSLQFIDGVFRYATIDETKQIVKQVALESLNQVLVFKVVKETEEGDFDVLTDDEQTRFRQYVNMIKFPGTSIRVKSDPADNIKLSFKIYYDALLSQADIETAINETVSNYIKNIVFNGKFVPTKLIDEIQKIAGVEIPIYVSGQHKNYSESDYVDIGDFFTAAAGYSELTELNLEFIANV